MVDHLYKFDEKAGVIASDSISGINAELIQLDVPAAWVEGQVNGGVRFRINVDERVEVPSSILEGALDCSIASWVNVDDLGFTRWFSGADTTTGLRQLHFLAGLDATPVIIVRRRNSANTIVSFPGTLVNGDNHHIGFTINGATNQLKAYFNGDLIRTATMPGTPNIPLTFDKPLYIGNDADNPTVGRSWEGLIDEFFISDRLLTDEEMEELFNPPIVIPPAATKKRGYQNRRVRHGFR